MGHGCGGEIIIAGRGRAPACLDCLPGYGEAVAWRVIITPPVIPEFRPIRCGKAGPGLAARCQWDICWPEVVTKAPASVEPQAMGDSMRNRRDVIAAGGTLALAGPLAAGLAAGLAACDPGYLLYSRFAGQGRKQPLIIAHRGASGERPEHTLSSYALGIEQGADFIEPDLVFTKDGELVCRHENEISGTTDVAIHPEFAGRKTEKTIDGEKLTGWFTEDFTLAELRTLRARERLPGLRPGNTRFDGQDVIPTFAELLALVREAAKRRGKAVGVYPELKHPSFFEGLGFAPGTALLAELKKAGIDDPASPAFAANPVYIQCFEAETLRKLAADTRIPLIELWFANGLRDRRRNRLDMIKVKRYAAGIGVEKIAIFPLDRTERSAGVTPFIYEAHRVGLLVHAWTFRAENTFLPAELRRGDPASPGYQAAHGDIEAEIGTFIRVGLDGIFTDFPAAGLRAREAEKFWREP